MDGYISDVFGDISIWQGDCLKLMKHIGDSSIDLLLTDLPYGSTDCEWDIKIDLEEFWIEVKRIITSNGCIAMTASQPYSTDLINSNREMFKYCWIWDKGKGGNIMSCKYQPYKVHEEVLIFSKGAATKTKGNNPMNYYPIMEEMKRSRIGRNYKKSDIYSTGKMEEGYSKQYTHTYPKSIIKISNAKQGGKIHPTQKPVELFEYLIRTYTTDGMTILDPCSGSGTTLEASLKLGRRCIGIEADKKYYDLICDRIRVLRNDL